MPAAAPRTANPRTPLEQTAWPKVSAAIRERFVAAGKRLPFAAGHRFFEVGCDNDRFTYVDAGEVDIVDRLDEHTVVTVTAGSFIGELGLLMGQRTFLAAVATTDGVAYDMPVATLRDLIASVPEVADCVVAAFAARRRLLIENSEGGLHIVGRSDDRDALRLVEFARRNGIPFKWVDRADGEAVDELTDSCSIPADGVAAVLPGGRTLERPDPCTLAQALGLDLGIDPGEVFDLAIVGAGPGGLAAAVYGASEGLRTVIIEDTAIGGQAGTSSRIENYLGFPQGVSGSELAYRAQVQAVKFGAHIAAPRRATALLRDGDAWCVRLEADENIGARTVVLANGVQYRRLAVERLGEYEGEGVYYAATDLEARFCRNTTAVVIGGGNSAGQAAMFLSRYAECTYIAVRGAGLADTMSSYLSDRIHSDARIELLTHHELCGVGGEGHLERVTLRDNRSGHERAIDCRALFVMIGAEPNTDWLRGEVELDEKGFVLTGADAGAAGMATSAPGVFAVGDIRSGSVKRVASAVGEGSVVVSAVHAYLGGLGEPVVSAADDAS